MAERNRDVSTPVTITNAIVKLNSISRLSKSIKFGKYYGKCRNIGVKEYLDLDLVFTTYHTIASSMNQIDSTIFSIKWFRIVLDEGRSKSDLLVVLLQLI